MVLQSSNQQPPMHDGAFDTNREFDPEITALQSDVISNSTSNVML